jgi:hypothetical protein
MYMYTSIRSPYQRGSNCIIIASGKYIVAMPMYMYDKLTRVSVSIWEVDWEVRADFENHAKYSRGILFSILGQDVKDVLTSACTGVYVCMCVSESVYTSVCA